MSEPNAGYMQIKQHQEILQAIAALADGLRARDAQLTAISEQVRLLREEVKQLLALVVVPPPPVITTYSSADVPPVVSPVKVRPSRKAKRKGKR